MALEIIVLAAGKGTRMRSDRPKVLHELAGEPLLAHVLRTARRLNPDVVHVVNGHGAEAVRDRFDAPDIRWVSQAPQLGTAHAVKQAMPGVAPGAVVLVIYGDVPLISPAVLEQLVRCAETSDLCILTANAPDPTGYGRIVRDPDGKIARIVEEKDTDHEQRLIREINTGFIAARGERLGPWLEAVENSNAQGEYYLTDVIEIAAAAGARVTGLETAALHDALGVNTQRDLAELETHLRARRAREFFECGVKLVDPARFDARGDIVFGTDCVVDVNVVLIGPLTIGNDVYIGPNNVVENATIGDHAIIKPNCVIDGAHIGARAVIGPFARLRPGANLAERVHIGNFVEIKNSDLAEDAKANHLSYVGDSSVGRNANIGAGVITCNYDGAQKHRTTIEDDVFVGSNSQLVAPVTVGKGATVAAGTTITSPVPPGSLAISRVKQRHIQNWKRPAKK